MRQPYIGVCDFTAPEQTARLLRYFSEGPSHRLMVGVMMSYKTLNGIPSKWSQVFPPKEAIRSIFIDDPRVMNTIHYADYVNGPLSDKLLARTLEKVFGFGGEYLDAIQLDMIWPDPGEIKKFRSRFDIPIVLQVGEHAMALCGNDPLLVCDYLKAYGLSVDYVLFDKSMGRGKGMDAALLATYVGALEADCPHLSPAVAGGLGPSSMDLIRPLVAAYPGISMDMQSKLRLSGSMEDPIDWWMAEEAVRQAVVLHRRIV